MADDVLDWPVRTAEYMHFAVTANVDPLADDVTVALVAHRSPPTDADYTVLDDVAWVDGQTWTVDSPIVRCRAWVPKDTLTRGSRYDAHVRVVDNPEIPEMFAGVVKGA